MPHIQTRISTGDDGPDMTEASFYLRKVYVNKIFDVMIILITTLLAVWIHPYHLTRFSMQFTLHSTGIKKQQLVCVGLQVVLCRSMQACFVLDSVDIVPMQISPRSCLSVLI